MTLSKYHQKTQFWCHWKAYSVYYKMNTFFSFFCIKKNFFFILFLQKCNFWLNFVTFFVKWLKMHQIWTFFFLLRNEIQFGSYIFQF